jgi:YjbE family integral membrane protein
MIEFFQGIHWAAVAQIILIDLLLGGDNAVVIALACRNLPSEQRVKGILWGTVGAIVLRIVLVAFAVTLLAIPFLKLVGGLLLLWIGVKLMIPEQDGHGDIKADTRLLNAIKTIIVADFVMSLDNVIAIAGAAQSAPDAHQIPLVVFGLLVSIPIVVFGSQLVLGMINRWPIIIAGGAALLGWIAGGLAATDPGVINIFGEISPPVQWALKLIGAAGVVAVGAWLTRRQTLRK